MSALAWQDLGRAVLAQPDMFMDELPRRRLRYFTARMFPGYQTSAHILTLIEALEWAVSTPDARLIVTMPPRHSKSLHVSENLPAWFLGRFPDKRLITASHTAQLAYTFSRRVRNKINDPRWPFPTVHVADEKGAVQAWDIDGYRGGYIAVGVGGAPTGHGADVIVVDDPFRSAADADSEIVRESIWEWWTGTLRTRLEPGGSIILTATRWNEDDLTGRLLAAQSTGGELWRHVDMPAINADNQALWPERWPLDALERLRAAIGSRAFEAQFQGRPSPQAGGIFKREWWQFYDQLPELATFDTIIQSWDMTFKETKAGSYVVGQVWGKIAADCYLIDQYRARVDFPGSVAAMRMMAEKWPLTREKLVEDKANGPAIVSTLKSEIPGLIEVSPEGGKEARANAISHLVEARNVHLPRGADFTDGLIEEAASFPNGRNDDQVDSMSQALVRLQTHAQDFAPVDGDLAGFFRRAGVSVG